MIDMENQAMRRTMKTLIPMAALALGALAVQAALAHGAVKPRHGGVVQVAHDVGFELVAGADGVTLHLMDHDAPMPTQGMGGKLIVLQGVHKTEAALTAAGDNKLRAAGVKLAKGDKAVAVLGPVAGKTVSVRFTIP